MNEIFPPNVFFTWDIHYRCNYYCTYCFLHFEPETANIEAIYLEPEKWMEIWQNIYKRYGPCHALVTGGEPFTYPNFIDLISKLSEIHTFEFSTNLSWDIDEFMEKVNAERVKIDSSFHPEFVSPEDFIKKFLRLKEKGYLLGGVTVVGYPPMLERIIEYKTKFEKEGIKLIIFPYRGPYQDRKYPVGYTEQERKLLKGLGAEVGEVVSNELMESYDSPDREISSQTIEMKLCRMGQRYGKVIPNGDVFRCCAAVWNPSKPWSNWGSLGNIANGTFNLLDNPEPCIYHPNCKCYKAMIIGEEDRWSKHWSNVNIIIEKVDEKKILDSAKVLRNESKFEEAINKINLLLIKKPTGIKALVLLGEIYIEKKDFVSAENTLLIALEKGTSLEDKSWIYRTLGRLYRESTMYHMANDKPEERLRKSSIALEYLKKAKESAIESGNDTDKIWSFYEVAYIFYLCKDYTLAKENIEIALNYEPGNKYFKELLGNIEALK